MLIVAPSDEEVFASLCAQILERQVAAVMVAVAGTAGGAVVEVGPDGLTVPSPAPRSSTGRVALSRLTA